MQDWLKLDDHLTVKQTCCKDEIICNFLSLCLSLCVFVCVFLSALSADIRAHMCLTGCFKAKGIVLKGLLNTTIQSKVGNFGVMSSGRMWLDLLVRSVKRT